MSLARGFRIPEQDPAVDDAIEFSRELVRPALMLIVLARVPLRFVVVASLAAQPIGVDSRVLGGLDLALEPKRSSSESTLVSAAETVLGPVPAGEAPCQLCRHPHSRTLPDAHDAPSALGDLPFVRDRPDFGRNRPPPSFTSHFSD